MSRRIDRTYGPGAQEIRRFSKHENQRPFLREKFGGHQPPPINPMVEMMIAQIRQPGLGMESKDGQPAILDEESGKNTLFIPKEISRPLQAVAAVVLVAAFADLALAPVRVNASDLKTNLPTVAIKSEKGQTGGIPNVVFVDQRNPGTVYVTATQTGTIGEVTNYRQPVISYNCDGGCRMAKAGEQFNVIGLDRDRKIAYLRGELGGTLNAVKYGDLGGYTQFQLAESTVNGVPQGLGLKAVGWTQVRQGTITSAGALRSMNQDPVMGAHGPGTIFECVFASLDLDGNSRSFCLITRPDTSGKFQYVSIIPEDALGLYGGNKWQPWSLDVTFGAVEIADRASECMMGDVYVHSFGASGISGGVRIVSDVIYGTRGQWASPEHRLVFDIGRTLLSGYLDRPLTKAEEAKIMCDAYYKQNTDFEIGVIWMPGKRARMSGASARVPSSARFLFERANLTDEMLEISGNYTTLQRGAVELSLDLAVGGSPSSATKAGETVVAHILQKVDGGYHGPSVLTDGLRVATTQARIIEKTSWFRKPPHFHVDPEIVITTVDGATNLVTEVTVHTFQLLTK